jgi:hypothetical protein
MIDANIAPAIPAETERTGRFDAQQPTHPRERRFFVALIIWASAAIGLTIVVTDAAGNLNRVVIISLPLAIISLVFLLRRIKSRRNRNALLLAGIGLYLQTVGVSALFIEQRAEADNKDFAAITTLLESMRLVTDDSDTEEVLDATEQFDLSTVEGQQAFLEDYDKARAFEFLRGLQIFSIHDALEPDGVDIGLLVLGSLLQFLAVAYELQAPDEDRKAGRAGVRRRQRQRGSFVPLAPDIAGSPQV